jgi:class 3 adenylate cyclase
MQLEQLPHGIHAAPHGSLDLRGFPGEVEVFELSGELIDGERRDASELWTRAPFGL